MGVLEAILLGILQGVTEFLPVSSSGHLVLAMEWLGLAEHRTAFIVLLHVASAAAIAVYFRRDLVRLLTDRRREILWLAIGSIPAGIVGVLWKDRIEAVFLRPDVAGLGLLLTGAVLFVADRREGDRPPDGPRALAIGAAQAVALLPGVSRSGMTISAGLVLGIARPDAFRFAFLLGFVAILGAGALEMAEARMDLSGGPLLAGALASFGSSFGSLRLLDLLVRRRRLRIFAAYTVVLGLCALVWVATT